MPDCPAELLDLERFLATPSDRRLAIGRDVAASLGADWTAHDLVGEKGLASVRNEKLGLVFTVVPGGRFLMGLREDDLAELARHLDLAEENAAAFLNISLRCCRPVREVHVRPHLFAREQLSADQVALLDPSLESGEVTRDEARRLAEAASLRLPTEAEYEWVAREGGALHFIADLASKYDGSYLSPFTLENGFGLVNLFGAQWMDDDHHETYVGAPSTSEAWRDGGAEGVLRGGLDVGIESSYDLLFCLAAHRGGGDLITLRLARSL